MTTSSSQLRIMAKILYATIHANELVHKPESVRVAICAVMESISALLDAIYRAEMDDARRSVKEPNHEKPKPFDQPKPRSKRKSLAEWDALRAKTMEMFACGIDLTTNHVREHLGVSVATAIRLLESLQSDGLIEQLARNDWTRK